MAEWMVRLTGDASDLARLSAAFSHGPFRVTTEGDEHHLRAPEFNDLSDADRIAARAPEVIAFANGIVKLAAPEHRNVGFGGVRRENGEVHEWRWVEDTFRVTDSVSLTGTHPDGTVDVVDTAQRLDSDAAVALAHREVARALRLFARGESDWGELYKVLEIVAADVGGVGRIETTGWATRSQLGHFKHTANSVGALGDEARHGSDRTQPPPNPMTLEDATVMIRAVLRGWIDSKK